MAQNIPPGRRTADLLIGRVSVPGAVYFLTLCEAKRLPRLTTPAVAAAMREALNQLQQCGDFLLVAATVMPDHVHLLGRLGPRLSLSRVVGKLKSVTRRPLSDAGACWQENYYDHRLRDENKLEPFARYIFMNPYRAKLTERDKSWPFWMHWGDTRFQFEEAINSAGIVPAPWLEETPPEGTSDL